MRISSPEGGKLVRKTAAQGGKVVRNDKPASSISPTRRPLRLSAVVLAPSGHRMPSEAIHMSELCGFPQFATLQLPPGRSMMKDRAGDDTVERS